MSDNEQTSIEEPDDVDENQDEPLHYIEDLEERKNASGPVTTHAVGEENGSGGW